MEPRREIASVEGNEYYACLIRDWHSIKPQCRGAGDIIFKDDKMIEGKYLAFEVSGDKPRVVDRIFLSDSEFSQRGWSKENEITGKVKIILTCVDINSQLRK